MSTRNLTGQWSGFYIQHDRAHPIALDLVQDGDRIQGSMRDGETDRVATVFDVAAEAGLPPGADEQIVARLREAFPDEASAPIRAVTHLPPDSRIEGWVRGVKVHFLKTYQGTSFSGYQVGNKRIGHESKNHSVHYEGTVNDQADTLTGRWWIESQIGPVVHRTEGTFQLQRATP